MKSKLDLLLEVLQTMTDEEIVEATQNTSHAPYGELGLSDYEFCFEDKRMPAFATDYKKIDDELYNYVMDFQSLYNNISNVESDKKVDRTSTLAA